MNYKRISFKDTDTGEVLGNALLGDNEELIVKTENVSQMEAIKRKLKLSNEIKQFIEANEGRYFHLIYKYCHPIMLE